jgi:hypothetical protein
MESRIPIAAVITTNAVLAVVTVACTREPRRDPSRIAEPRLTPAIVLQRSSGRAIALQEPAMQEPAGPALLRARAEAHDMLARHCGSCHEGHQPTAKPAALAVFDLDQPDWPARFDAHRFEAALGRLASKPDADRTIFVALRDAELASRAKL